MSRTGFVCACIRLLPAIAFVALAAASAPAGDDAPATPAEAGPLETLVAPGPNRPDEALASEFSLARATDFLDAVSVDWQRTRKCMTCHTNYAYLMARPAISADAPAHAVVRKFAEDLVSTRWKEQGPRWDTEVVATATSLAFNDAATTGHLHPLTREALDRMWTVQREDGGWTWLDCDWPPMEIDDHYGVTLAAIGVGVAPDEYAETPAAQQGMEKIRKYLAANPPPTLHHAAMVLWASTYVDGLLDDAGREKIIASLSDLQKPDGGWCLATMGDWKRGDDLQQDTEHSDGYATGFVSYVLMRAGVPDDDARIARAVEWLKRNQRESGRWFTRSLYKDKNHFLSHVGSAFAVMALAEADALD